MLKKILILTLSILLLGTFLYADVCTAWVFPAHTKKMTAYIDYGQGNTEDYQTKSLTDFIMYLENKGWKLESSFYVGDGYIQMIFRK